MTQTNNERKALLKTQDFIERIIEHTTDDWAKTELREVFNFIEHSLEKKPISQNEQQEPFGYFKAEPFGWTDCAETEEGAIPLYESPPKQAIPEGWKLVPIEPTVSMIDKGQCGCMDNDVTVCIYKKMLNAAPTNTEVGE